MVDPESLLHSLCEATIPGIKPLVGIRPTPRRPFPTSLSSSGRFDFGDLGIILAAAWRIRISIGPAGASKLSGDC